MRKDQVGVAQAKRIEPCFHEQAGAVMKNLHLGESACAGGAAAVQCLPAFQVAGDRRQEAAGVRRIVIPGRPWQIGATLGATPGGYTGNSGRA